MKEKQHNKELLDMVRIVIKDVSQCPNCSNCKDSALFCLDFIDQYLKFALEEDGKNDTKAL